MSDEDIRQWRLEYAAVVVRDVYEIATRYYGLCKAVVDMRVAQYWRNVAIELGTDVGATGRPGEPGGEKRKTGDDIKNSVMEVVANALNGTTNTNYRGKKRRQSRVVKNATNGSDAATGQAGRAPAADATQGASGADTKKDGTSATRDADACGSTTFVTDSALADMKESLAMAVDCLQTMDRIVNGETVGLPGGISLRRNQIQVLERMSEFVAQDVRRSLCEHSYLRSGYGRNRKEFDKDPNAMEKRLQQLTLSGDDADAETIYKLRILSAYQRYVVERNEAARIAEKFRLQDVDDMEAAHMRKSPEMRYIFNVLMQYARVLSPADFEVLRRGHEEEHALKARLRLLQGYRRMGARTLAEMDMIRRICGASKIVLAPLAELVTRGNLGGPGVHANMYSTFGTVAGDPEKGRGMVIVKQNQQMSSDHYLRSTDKDGEWSGHRRYRDGMGGGAGGSDGSSRASRKEATSASSRKGSTSRSVVVKTSGTGTSTSSRHGSRRSASRRMHEAKWIRYLWEEPVRLGFSGGTNSWGIPLALEDGAPWRMGCGIMSYTRMNPDIFSACRELYSCTHSWGVAADILMPAYVRSLFGARRSVHSCCHRLMDYITPDATANLLAADTRGAVVQDTGAAGRSSRFHITEWPLAKSRRL